MNDNFMDLATAAPWLLRRPSLPGPVRQLYVHERRGALMLRWLPPRGSQVAGYRIDRTREGRDYETVTETSHTQVFLPKPPLHESWFYRVRALNVRGVGGYKWVCLYQRRGWSTRTKSASVIQHLPVIPGLRINIFE